MSPERPEPETPPAPAPPPAPPDAAEVRFRLRRATLGTILAAGGYGVALWGGWRWATSRSPVAGVPWPFRRAHEFNELVWGRLIGPKGRAREFPRTAARAPRTNGGIGLAGPAPDPATWRLRVVGSSAAGGEAALTLDDLRALPRAEGTTELKCVEGWSQVVHWAGVRLADVAAATGLATRRGGPPDPDRPEDLYRYAALETPDGAYYVGLDAASALHPQTLLAMELNGEPLTPEHGAPLRLAIPIKYGIKNLKRIGTIRFTDERPSDYWAERGYDWYAGL